jgi:hypothetical protein
MLNFWSLPRRLRPKIWPKEGQNFSKSKKLKILSEDKKNYSKITTFCLNKQKITSLVYFLAFEGHLSQKNQQTNQRSIFLFVLAKTGCFAIIFLILA